MAVLWESTFDDTNGTGILNINASFWSSTYDPVKEWTTLNGSLVSSGTYERYTLYRATSSANQLIHVECTLLSDTALLPEIGLRCTETALVEGKAYQLIYFNGQWTVQPGYWVPLLHVTDSFVAGDVRKITYGINDNVLFLEILDGDDVVIYRGYFEDPNSRYVDANNLVLRLRGTYGDPNSVCSYEAVSVGDYAAATAAPVAGFTFPTSTRGGGQYQRTGGVALTDTSLNTPTAWAWSVAPADGASFDDDAAQNPTLTVADQGDYAVTLTATNAGGSDAITQTLHVRNDWTITGTQTIDTPTNNHCVLAAETGTLSDGNLTATGGTATVTLHPTTGKWSYKQDDVEQLYDADVSGGFNPTLTAGTYDFGASGYTPASGYKTLCATNLEAYANATIGE